MLIWTSLRLVNYKSSKNTIKTLTMREVLQEMRVAKRKMNTPEEAKE